MVFAPECSIHCLLVILHEAVGVVVNQSEILENKILSDSQSATSDCGGSSRQRCNMKRDLPDAPGRHRSQAPVPTTLPVTCRGRAKFGSPCPVTWGLTADGYCKFHVPGAAQCRGIARSTGHRCRISWDLNALGYCRHHLAQSRASQCIAIAHSTGQRCQKTVGIDRDGFCSVHNPTNANTPICQGVLPNSVIPCTNGAKPRFKYCCAAHDPSLVNFYSPSFFGDSKLRSSRAKNVVKLYGGRDLYHGDWLDLTTDGFVEMDHILEKQCFSYAFNLLPFQQDREDADFLASWVREKMVNEVPNLCLTRATTNRIKGAAVWKFLDDCSTGHVGYRGSASFADYLLAENRDAVRLGRETTRVIAGEMGAALKFCQRRLADEGETPMLDALSGQLQNLYVRMQLHTSRSAAALAGRTKSQQSNTKSISERHGTHRPEGGSVVSDGASKSLSFSAVPFTPRAIETVDPITQTSKTDRTESEDVKSVKPSGVVNESNASKTLGISVSAGHKLKALDAFAKVFVRPACRARPCVTASK